MMAMAGYGDVVAKTRTYLHRQLEFFLSDTSCWIQKKYNKLKYILAFLNIPQQLSGR